MIRAAILILAFAVGTRGQQLSVRGTVTDEGKTPVARVSISLEPGGLNATTNDVGVFTIENVAPGSYLLTATGRGFVPWQETVLLSTLDAVVTIRLATVQTTIEVREVADDFLATASVSVTKSPQSLIDLPYAVQVIPKALLDSRAIQDIKDLYRNISGMTDSPYTAMTFRGFTQREILFNGVRGNPYGSLENDINDAGFSTSQGRLSNIEFAELLAIGIETAVVKLGRQVQQPVLGLDPHRPVDQQIELGGVGDVADPLLPASARQFDDVLQIARTQASGDGELHVAQ
jgi:hypothetical protein